MFVNGQLHAPIALPPGKEPPVRIGYEAGWDPEPVWTRWQNKKNPSHFREPNSGRSLWSTVTELTGLS